MRQAGNFKLHRVPWVAEQLGVSDRQVYRLFESGDLVRARVGKRGTRVTDESLQDYFRRIQGAA